MKARAFRCFTINALWVPNNLKLFNWCGIANECDTNVDCKKNATASFHMSTYQGTAGYPGYQIYILKLLIARGHAYETWRLRSSKVTVFRNFNQVEPSSKSKIRSMQSLRSKLPLKARLPKHCRVHFTLYWTQIKSACGFHSYCHLPRDRMSFEANSQRGVWHQ